MENHPIPQDITGFQFKLIGNMTVRQFIYLAVGTVLAWLFFFVLHLPFLIKLPLALISVGLGAATAFVPIDGRPMDTMIANFFKALFAPTQYIYKKNGGDLSTQLNQPAPPPTPTVQTPSQTPPPPPVIQMPAPQPVATPPPTPAGLIPAQEAQPTPAIHLSAPGGPSPMLQPTTGDNRVIDLGDKQSPSDSGILEGGDKPKAEKELEQNEKKLEEEVATLKKELDETKKEEKAETDLQAPPAAHQKAEELEKLLAETARQKEALEKELLKLNSKLESQGQQRFNPATAIAPLPQTQRVRRIPHGMEKSVGLPNAPQEPNLITGIIKDPRNNPLPNILVEVKDLDDNPVRAFKTNGLGQFASATSLSNGRYVVSFEDPKSQNKFDTVELDATGAPILPLEIISIDSREELRRELFN